LRSEAAALQSDDAPAQAAHHTPEAILAHARFPAARKAYVDGVLALYENRPWVNRQMAEVGRMVTYMVLLCLYARYDPADRRTWPTVGRLKEALKPFGVASPRQIDLILARLEAIGLVSLRVAEDDQRMRLLTPTEAMLAYDLDWLAAHYAPLALLFPEDAYALPLARDVRFQVAQRRAATEIFGWSARIMSENREMALFLGRDSAGVILYKLVQTMDDGGGEPRISLSYADTAARFGVSRTHVRTVLRGAEAEGLVRLSGRGGAGIEIMPGLIAALDRLIADGMSSHDLTWRMAMRRIEAGDFPPGGVLSAAGR
jgi:hypothetical protein